MRQRQSMPKTVDALEKIHTLETSRSRYVNSVYSHEKMHRNVICTWSVIFSANNGPTAVLHSKASYVAFTRLIQQSHSATWWLSPCSHTVLLYFINWSALGWWWFKWYSHWVWCACICHSRSNVVWNVLRSTNEVLHGVYFQSVWKRRPHGWLLATVYVIDLQSLHLIDLQSDICDGKDIQSAASQLNETIDVS